MADAGTTSESQAPAHPKAFEPAVLVLSIVTAAFGAVIGMQILTTLGITPSTAIIGVLVAILVSRLPLRVMQRFRDVHRQNLVQTSISTATFTAANSLLLPIGIPVLTGRPDLVLPVMVGAVLAMTIDLLMLYWMYDSRIFPARNAWPPGLAAAEAIAAGDQGGERARLLVYGLLLGGAGSAVGIPMSAFGVAFIGNVMALMAFGVGLLAASYLPGLIGYDFAANYLPHGMMIGAGVVALGQAIVIVSRRQRSDSGHVPASPAGSDAGEPGGSAAPATTDPLAAGPLLRSDRHARTGMIAGFVAYLGVGLLIAVISGLVSAMPLGQFLGWLLFAAVACLAAEFIVGLSAMHAGWFPSFAIALIFLILGIVLGYPPVALVLLVGFVAAGSPAFADAGYDLKTGWLLRGRGFATAYEVEGRKQQLLISLVTLVLSSVVVWFAHDLYFSRDLFPPVDRVFAQLIDSGVDASVIGPMFLWAIPGALVQLVGGPRRQVGVLLATGLLVANPSAGFAVLAGLTIRILVSRLRGASAESTMTVMAAGVIAGDALFSFFSSVYKLVVPAR
ncbi:OPT/YSL family transporter [Pseudonocardia sp. MH-G8]|uniref:OPT/YSL family transporter n=1 Tax=Pseudonocardia sp. MH-G8 TaxID=1854588 RepID=UPI000BA06FDF|nr:OPT/YSL family transporter [Pseudonocardia sp. MH-G8]OZM77967.1 hypothetical protein CFP66_33435 [Pseudonocardia sp. MH-G8]